VFLHACFQEFDCILIEFKDILLAPCCFSSTFCQDETLLSVYFKCILFWLRIDAVLECYLSWLLKHIVVGKEVNFNVFLLLTGNTQMTVNNQIVSGTLMNLADNPTRVSIGQKWRESDITNRVPIIITGNDLSTLYAPLIRDGRMEKFYWYVCPI
jgi:hypothetical protein